MTIHVLMTHPSFHQKGILGGNGMGVTRAIQLGRMLTRPDDGPVEVHGFAGLDFMNAFQRAAPGMGAVCLLTGCEGDTRIDLIVSEGNGTETLHKNYRPDSYRVTLHDFRSMRDQLMARLQPGDTLIVTGSRPAWDYDGEFDVDWDQVTYDLYVGIPRWAQVHGVYVAFDGPPRDPSDAEAPPGPLEIVFASNYRPDMIKMNRTEWNAVASQFLAANREYAAEIAFLGVDSPEWRLRVAEKLMPQGFLVLSFKKHLFAYLNGEAWLYTLDLSDDDDLKAEYADRWVTSVGRGDTVMGTLMALRGHAKGVLWALKYALAARAAQTFYLSPGVYAIIDVLKLKGKVKSRKIARVERQPVGSRS